MAKDPATLWYWNDWHSGTVTLSRFLKGCYMDLLHAQFNNGSLSLAEIKTILGTDFGPAWPTLQKKFMQDANGNFFNKKAETVKEDRKKFLEKQRANGQKGGRPPSNKTQINPNHNPNLTNKESEIENEILIEVKKEKRISVEDSELLQIIKKCDKTTEHNAREMITDQAWHEQVCMSLSIDSISMLMPFVKSFVRQKIAGGELDKHYSQCKSHFINWLKIEIKKQNSNGQSSGSTKGKSSISTSETGKLFRIANAASGRQGSSERSGN